MPWVERRLAVPATCNGSISEGGGRRRRLGAGKRGSSYRPPRRDFPGAVLTLCKPWPTFPGTIPVRSLAHFNTVVEANR